MIRPATALAMAAMALLLQVAGCRGGQQGTPPPSPDAATAEQGRPGARLLPVPGASSTGDALPPGHPPISGRAGSVVPPSPGSGGGATGLAWRAPAGWIEEAPSSSMRKAQYRVPGPAGDGECVVFYFGPGQGGDAMANAKRWAGQFRQPDGRSSEEVMRTSRLEAGDVHVLLVEVSGIYEGGMTMTDEPAEPKPGFMLLGAIAEGPDANWFFKLTGPEATVKAERPAFERMLRSLARVIHEAP